MGVEVKALQTAVVERIQAALAEGLLSHRAIARLHGVSHTAVAKYADEDRFNTERRAYRAQNAALIRERKHAYTVANRAALTQSRAEWRSRNLQRDQQTFAAYYTANREAYLARCAAWQKAHPEWVRAKCHRRRACGTLSALDIKQTFEVCDGLCAYCLRPAPKPTVDHVLPLIRGGSNTPDNLIAACRSCNARKHAKTPLEFLCKLPKLS